MKYVMITLERRFLRTVALPTGETLLRADEGTPPDGAVFERVDLAHGRVALRVPDGRYLAPHLTHPTTPLPDGAGLSLVGELTPCAAFEELQRTDGSVSLRGCDLRFLGVHPGGGVVADSVSDGSWERFRYVEVQVGVPAVPSQVACPCGPVVLAAV